MPSICYDYLRPFLGKTRANRPYTSHRKSSLFSKQLYAHIGNSVCGVKPGELWLRVPVEKFPNKVKRFV